MAQNVNVQKQPVQPTKVAQPMQATQPVEGAKDKKWIVALILSILLGGLGIDRFYMGYIWQGILKLITGGGLGIWWLIDWIMIAAKHNYSKVNWI